MQEYVVGFLLSGGRVLLIKKQRPEWQRGLLNGIGGKPEPGESPWEAMRREAIEEAGVDVEWEKFCMLVCRDPSSSVGSIATVHFFMSYDAGAFDFAKTKTDESLERVFIRYLPVLPVVPNVRWLVPMAKSMVLGERAEGFNVTEVFF
jgi:8-oxo-dGTP diphosphatase